MYSRLSFNGQREGTRIDPVRRALYLTIYVAYIFLYSDAYSWYRRTHTHISIRPANLNATRHMPTVSAEQIKLPKPASPQNSSCCGEATFHERSQLNELRIHICQFFWAQAWCVPWHVRAPWQTGIAGLYKATILSPNRSTVTDN